MRAADVLAGVMWVSVACIGIAIVVDVWRHQPNKIPADAECWVSEIESGHCWVWRFEGAGAVWANRPRVDLHPTQVKLRWERRA